jgi:hypothetical protein
MKKIFILVLLSGCGFIAMNPEVIPEAEHLTEEVFNDVYQYENKNQTTVKQTSTTKTEKTEQVTPEVHLVPIVPK